MTRSAIRALIIGVVLLGDGTNRLNNSGMIRGDEGAFNANLDSVLGGFGNDTVTNSGTIVEGVNLGGGRTRSDNSGTIDGTVSLRRFGGGNDTVTNSGVITGGVFLGDGVDTLTNSGTITGVVLGGDGIDTVTNTGRILGTHRPRQRQRHFQRRQTMLKPSAITTAPTR